MENDGKSPFFTGKITISMGKLWKITIFYGKLTISMAMFNSYV